MHLKPPHVLKSTLSISSKGARTFGKQNRQVLLENKLAETFLKAETEKPQGVMLGFPQEYTNFNTSDHKSEYFQIGVVHSC